MALTTSWTWNGEPLIAASSLYGPAAAAANSFYLPVGPFPSRCTVIAPRDLALSAISSGSGTLRIWQSDAGGTGVASSTPQLVQLTNLRPIRATRLLAGAKGEISTRAPMLLEIADRRWGLMKFTSANRQFNVRSWAADADFVVASINAGTAWTWQEVLSELWDDCGLGSLPSLPAGVSLPSDKPENLRFFGVSAWAAFHIVAHSLGITTKYDPIADSFGLIDAAATPPSRLPNILFDAETVDCDANTLPATIRVLFPFGSEDFGAEDDTSGLTATDISADPVRYVDVATGVSGASGKLEIWGDLPALKEWGETSNTVGTTWQAILNNRAADLAAGWLAENQPNSWRQVLPGIQLVYPSASYRMVAWKDRAGASGAVTEVGGPAGVPRSLWGNEFDGCIPPRFMGGGGIGGFDSRGLAAKLDPAWPRVVQVVDMTGGTGAGDDKDPDDASNNLFTGKVSRFSASTGGGGSWANNETIWIQPSSGSTLQQRRYLGRLQGLIDDNVGGNRRPFYVVDPGGGGSGGGVGTDTYRALCKFTLTSGFSGSPPTASATLNELYSSDTSTPDAETDSITVYDRSSSGLYDSAISGCEGVAVYQDTDSENEWHVIWIERPAQFIEFEIADSGDEFDTTDSSHSVTFRRAFNGHTSLSDGSAVTVYNRENHATGDYLFVGLSGDTGHAVWNWESARYEITFMTCT